MTLDHIPWHDTQVIRLVEEPAQDRVTLEVEYCPWEIDPDADPHAWLAGRIIFTGCPKYRIEEGAGFVNGCTVLEARIIHQEDERWWVRLETTSGHRDFLCAAIELELTGTATA